jgi:hypothetical protein
MARPSAVTPCHCTALPLKGAVDIEDSIDPAWRDVLYLF